MPSKKLIDFLNENGIKFVLIHHSRAYTANEVAHSAHIHGQELAKTVIVKIDGKLAMAVRPASGLVNTRLLKEELGVGTIEVAGEYEFASMFPECEVGAEPPFGNLYGMDVYVSDALAQDTEIAFNAGTHTELIRMAYEDFERLVKPEVLRF